MARCVWALVDEEVTEHISINNCGNAKDWLFFLIDTLSHEKFTKVIITLWAIWGARRKAIHEEIFQSPLTVYGFITNYLAELNQIQTINNPRLQVPAVPPAAPWIAPPSSAVKVNVDAAVSKYGNRGVVAAICRDEHGAFLGASVLAVQGIADPATLEAIACREGLALCSDLHVNRIILASDCLEVVNAIKEGSRGSYFSVLCEINQCSSAFA
jgi:hypothetical protein